MANSDTPVPTATAAADPTTSAPPASPQVSTPPVSTKWLETQDPWSVTTLKPSPSSSPTGTTTAVPTPTVTRSTPSAAPTRGGTLPGQHGTSVPLPPTDLWATHIPGAQGPNLPAPNSVPDVQDQRFWYQTQSPTAYGDAIIKARQTGQPAPPPPTVFLAPPPHVEPGQKVPGYNDDTEDHWINSGVGKDQKYGTESRSPDTPPTAADLAGPLPSLSERVVAGGSISTNLPGWTPDSMKLSSVDTKSGEQISNDPAKLREFALKLSSDGDIDQQFAGALDMLAGVTIRPGPFTEGKDLGRKVTQTVDQLAKSMNALRNASLSLGRALSDVADLLAKGEQDRKAASERLSGDIGDIGSAITSTSEY